MQEPVPPLTVRPLVALVSLVHRYVCARISLAIVALASLSHIPSRPSVICLSSGNPERCLSTCHPGSPRGQRAPTPASLPWALSCPLKKWSRGSSSSRSRGSSNTSRALHLHPVGPPLPPPRPSLLAPSWVCCLCTRLGKARRVRRGRDGMVEVGRGRRDGSTWGERVGEGWRFL